MAAPAGATLDEEEEEEEEEEEAVRIPFINASDSTSRTPFAPL